MEEHNQFLKDFRLLLKKHLTERALAEVMAKSLEGSIEIYYATFLRCIVDPQRLNSRFLEVFYRIFQDDLDELRGAPSTYRYLPEFIKGDPGRRTLFEFFEIQRGHVLILQEQIDIVLEDYHRILLGYKSQIYLYHQLLNKYEEDMKDLDGGFDE